MLYEFCAVSQKAPLLRLTIIWTHINRFWLLLPRKYAITKVVYFPTSLFWTVCSFNGRSFCMHSSNCVCDTILAGAPRTVTDKITAGHERSCAYCHRHSEIWSRPWSDTARPTALARRSRPGSLQAGSDSSPVSERPRTTVSVGALHPGLQYWHAAASAFRQLFCHLYLPCRVFGSTLTAVGRSQLLARWPGTHSRILSRIQRTAQTVLGVYLKRTCSRYANASSALGVLNDIQIYAFAYWLTDSFPQLSSVSLFRLLQLFRSIITTQKLLNRVS